MDQHSTAEQHTHALDILDRLGPTTRSVLLLLHGYEQGARGECRAKVGTMAEKVGVGERAVRRALAALRDAGLWIRTEKRIRWSGRSLTALGRLVARAMLFEGNAIPTASQSTTESGGVAGHASPHASAHKREQGKHERSTSPSKADHRSDPADPPSTCDPRRYRRPGRGYGVSSGTWDAIAAWMDQGPCSWARCKMAYRAFARIRLAVNRSGEWKRYARLVGVWDADELIRLAVLSAVRSGADFGSVESASRYVGAVVMSCVRDHRRPS